jgi:hypothetical protein
LTLKTTFDSLCLLCVIPAIPLAHQLGLTCHICTALACVALSTADFVLQQCASSSSTAVRLESLNNACLNTFPATRPSFNVFMKRVGLPASFVLPLLSCLLLLLYCCSVVAAATLPCASCSSSSISTVLFSG